MVLCLMIGNLENAVYVSEFVHVPHQCLCFGLLLCLSQLLFEEELDVYSPGYHSLVKVGV